MALLLVSWILHYSTTLHFMLLYYSIKYEVPSKQVELKSAHAKNLLAEIREMWDEWDIRDGKKDDMIEFDAFYNGFMAPYFGCYRCDETKKALKALDMDSDGVV